jgi:hypothetical protein
MRLAVMGLLGSSPVRVLFDVFLTLLRKSCGPGIIRSPVLA